MDQPKIEIKIGKADKIINWIALALFLSCWITAFVGYQSLPERIPIHFNAAGEPDNYGMKGTIFLVPFIGSFLFFLMTGLSRFPHLFNYSIPITKENAPTTYLESTRVLRVINLIMQAVFLYIVVSIIMVATGKQAGLSSWFLPLFIFVIMIPTVYLLFKRYKGEKSS